MEREQVNNICSSACGFSTFMIGLCTKLNKEQRDPTEREATDIAERLEAVRQVAQSPKSIELD